MQPAFGSISIGVYVHKTAAFYEPFGVIFSIRTDNNIYIFDFSTNVCRLEFKDSSYRFPLSILNGAKHYKSAVALF